MWVTRIGVILALGVLIGGCATQNRVAVRSVREAVVDAPTLPTAVYSASDRNTADVYLTNLPQAALDPGASLEGVSGRIVHLHMFIAPKAGSTPIASSACSVTVRHVIIADGEAGVYSGGGFMQPRTRVGAEVFEGRVRDATLRLTGKTPGFVDALGPASMDATVSAGESEPTARRIGARVEELVRGLGSPGGAPEEQ